MPSMYSTRWVWRVQYAQLFRPAVIQLLGNAFPPAEFSDRDLAPHPSRMMRIFSSAEYCLRVARRMSLASRSDGVSGVLGFCLMPTPQVVTMSPKSSVPQAASSVSHVLMSDMLSYCRTLVGTEGLLRRQIAVDRHGDIPLRPTHTPDYACRMTTAIGINNLLEDMHVC